MSPRLERQPRLTLGCHPIPGPQGGGAKQVMQTRACLSPLRQRHPLPLTVPRPGHEPKWSHVLMKGERPSPPSAGRWRVANGSATAVVGATHGGELVASHRGRTGRDATDLLSGCTPRAERVASRYVRLDFRPEWTSLFGIASPPLDPGAERGARADDEGGASRRVCRELLLGHGSWIGAAGRTRQWVHR